MSESDNNISIANFILIAEDWLRLVARANHKSYEEMRVIVLEFLDSDIFRLSIQNSIYFLEPLIHSWDIDLATFETSVVVRFRPGEEQLKRFGFVEIESEPLMEEDGLKEFYAIPPFVPMLPTRK
ncbi:MAG TPA: hypothetical protein VJ521_00185 [Acidobacteriota bacterium]|nr:hypothetical protein [Acidobacteriota bacterium]